MIGKKEWFKRRKYGGWGIFPKTWQGWIYIAVIIALFVIIQMLPFVDEKNNMIATIVLAILVIADTFEIMIHIPMDERERDHEAKSERNALWTMLAILIAGILYQAISSTINKTVEVDPVIITALLGAVIVKAITNIYLERKN